MTDSHVAVADTSAGIPQANGNPQPGQFPYGDTYSPCATTDTYTGITLALPTSLRRSSPCTRRCGIRRAAPR